MLRTMHMTKRHRHHLLQNLNRISRSLIKTNPINRINTPRVTLITNIMPLLTTRLAILHLMTYSTLHRPLLFKINQRSFTNQTFFFYNIKQNYFANIQKKIQNQILLISKITNTFSLPNSYLLHRITLPSPYLQATFAEENRHIFISKIFFVSLQKISANQQ